MCTERIPIDTIELSFKMFKLLHETNQGPIHNLYCVAGIVLSFACGLNFFLARDFRYKFCWK